MRGVAKQRKSDRRPRASREGVQTVATNRKARFDYEITETFEAGIVLVGSEVKSVRAGEVQLRDAFGRVHDGEVWLHGMHVKPYELASKHVPDADRPRKLLLHHREIARLAGTTADRGITLVPLRVYFKHGLAKVELGVARGKRKHDKRRAIADREARREAERALKERQRG